MHALFIVIAIVVVVLLWSSGSKKAEGLAQATRDAMRHSYFKHLALARQGHLRTDISPHDFAMYGALATRYMAGFERISEPVVWCELAPFLRLEANEGLEALAEYVVYKELPGKANVSVLRARVAEGLQRWPRDERDTWTSMADARRLAWAELLQRPPRPTSDA
jgi:hypothetical protein